MVVALGPGKFYGNSLPRPRFYTDIKFSSDRVDPPTPVLDPLLSWAHEAHWSMGGLSFKRLRLMGRIEGSVTRLRAQRTRSQKDRIDRIRKLDDDAELEDSEPEPEPEPEVKVKPNVRKRGRKLVEEFEKVADADRVALRTRSRRPGSDKEVAAVRRSSPRKKV